MNANDLHHLSTVDLVKEIARRSEDLVKAQLALAKNELRADLAAEKKMIGGLGGASVAALTALNLLLVSVVFALSSRMAGWLAALIVAGFMLLVAAVAGAFGWHERVPRPLARTRHAIEEDVRWTKEKMA
jgi:hypothetical protein